MVKLTPASPAWTYSYLYTKSNLDSDLTTMLGGTTTATYVIGCYNNMDGVTVGSNFYGLIGLGIEVSAYPAGTPIYSPPTSGAYYLAQSHYLVKNGLTLTLCQMVNQRNPTAAVRFMIPFSTTYVMAGGFDYEDFTEPAEYGWGAYDTQANAVSGT